MCRYQVDFSLEGSSDGVEPAIRLWVDSTDDLVLSGEREVSLERRSATDWSAEFDMPQGAAPIWFRLGLAAEPGTEWHMVMKREDACEVFRDGDVLALAKEWVVGTSAG